MNRAAEGFSQTYWPHLLRLKLKSLVDSQEYRDILGKSDDNNSLKNLLSTYKRELEHNKSIVDQAKLYVPKSGYDTEKFYVQPTDSQGQPIDPKGFTADDTNTKASSSRSVDSETLSPTGSGWTSGYLTGDGIAPNGFPVTTAISFPTSPLEGDFVLRLDYKPNRLFRYDGNRWIKVEDSVRTTLDGDGLSQRDGFINNTGTYVDNKGKAKPSKTGLSKALEPDED